MRVRLKLLVCLLCAAPGLARPASAGQDIDLLSYDRAVTPPAPADAAPVLLERSPEDDIPGVEVIVTPAAEPVAPPPPPVEASVPDVKTKPEPKPAPPLDVKSPPPKPVLLRPEPAKPKPVSKAVESKPAPVAPPVAPLVAKPLLARDMLRVEDSLHIEVEGEAELSGTYVVARDGTITLPLIGVVPAAGRSPAALQADLVARFADGYLVDPRIKVIPGAGP